MAVKKIFIDTNIYVSFKKNNQNIVEEFQKSEYMALNAVVLAELYVGFKLGSKEKRNIDELNEFMENPRIYILPITEQTSLFYTIIYTQLRKKGKPVPTNDIWIAASTMEYGLILRSFDSHFKNIEGLLIK